MLRVATKPAPAVSRYRLARKGDCYRVEQWRRRFFWFGAYVWRPMLSLSHGHESVVRLWLRQLQSEEERPTWQPVP